MQQVTEAYITYNRYHNRPKSDNSEIFTSWKVSP